MRYSALDGGKLCGEPHKAQDQTLKRRNEQSIYAVRAAEHYRLYVLYSVGTNDYRAEFAPSGNNSHTWLNPVRTASDRLASTADIILL